ncbi:hypothetical protein HYFRA_00013460 [Hymenoscyphus fraxineus]|uniref:Nuclear pore complex protein An-Nup82 n=1 Tax=Hymenoscyphus fraxineus TaxID=746836 RepID=A0A9N9LAT8_9HELO|nr:hypothetical protein HYFRA_00013460 [Hymenoscyphus fraxineus]
MPKAIGYTPAWLSKPNPGYEIFNGAPSAANASYSSTSANTSRKRVSKPGPRRTIARRGTEIFTAVGKEIRWADLVYLKEAWESKQPKERRSRRQLEEDEEDEESQYDGDHAQGYRTLKTPVADDIRQIIISPRSNYLAILTTHTVHIAVLPESSHLTAPDTAPMKLKTYTLGPTTHVTSQSGIASALWHPLGVQDQCLVTVTEDAIVRVWELTIGNHSSFDKPTLSIDLKKLADGTSLDQDFGASVSGQSKGFTPDSIEMEVASACFAGRNSGGWSPMTLWVAMKEGDVYALCPLLPERWSPPATLIPSLSISVIAKAATMEGQLNVSQQESRLAQQQIAWMGDLDNQEPIYQESGSGDPPVEVYIRPAKPGKVPKLQGPFEFELAPEESEDGLDDMLTDIFVIGPKIDSEELMSGEEDDLELPGIDEEGGLSVGVVCLLRPSGRLCICLDLDGVEAQWLPKSKSKALRILDEADPPELLTFQVLDTLKSEEMWDGNWPMFSQDVNSGYSFFVTNTSTVTFISLSPWVFRLETELNGEAAGGEFRLDVLVKGQSTLRERVYTGRAKPNDHTLSLAASTVIRDPDLGYFLLTATQYGPQSISFELPEVEDYNPIQRSRSNTYESEPDKPLILCEPRPVYQPPHELEQPSKLPDLLKNLRHSPHKRILKENVRLSKATFQIMNEAHILLGDETHRLGVAAAELFRRCELLQIELQSQIKKAHDVAQRVEAIAGEEDEEGTGTISTDEAIDTRIMRAKGRQKELTERVERLKKKVLKGTAGKDLTPREREWVDEIRKYEWKVLGEGEPVSVSIGGRREVAREPFERFKEVQELEKVILEDVKALAGALVPSTPGNGNGNEGSGEKMGVKVPSEVRRRKEREIMKALERETALVEGAKLRLERLSLV